MNVTQLYKSGSTSESLSNRTVPNILTKQKSVAIVGAGVIGLAIARELSRRKLFEDIFVLEREKITGQQTSARNSEVIKSSMRVSIIASSIKSITNHSKILTERDDRKQ
jgi:NADPH-dependent 2,4-dienoyl-CoA reductase/sulfur reductase-like enzyme